MDSIVAQQQNQFHSVYSVSILMDRTAKSTQAPHRLGSPENKNN